MTYQQVEDIISNLRNKVTLGPLKRIIKMFSQFTKIEEQLPPQNLMAFAIFEIPGCFNKLLGVDFGEPVGEDLPLKISLQLQLYLNSMCNLLKESSEIDVQIVVLEGMARCYHFLFTFKKMVKPLLKLLVEIWARAQIKVKVRAFNVLNKIMSLMEDEEATWLLRRCYINYIENAKQVTWRNYEYLNLMMNCYVELCRERPEIAYFVIFSAIRQLAMQIDKTLKESKTKKKQLIKKFYSFQILNCLRLLTAVVTRIESQEISAMVYPLVQVLEAYARLNCASEFIPLRLHVSEMFIEITEKTGVLIPYTVDLLLEQLKCKDFLKKKPKTADNTQCQLQLIFQISQKNNKSTVFWGELFKQILKKIERLAATFCRMVSAPELLLKLRAILRQEYEQVKFAGYKIQIKTLIGRIKRDAQKLDDLRHNQKKLTPVNNKALSIFQQKLQSFQGVQTVSENSRVQRVDLKLLKDKLQAELHQDIVEDEEPAEIGEDEQGFVDDDQSAASSYQPSERDDKESEDEEQKEDIDYEGDPENPDELLKQWSQHEWSSQDQINDD